jgi:pimeloyl-ACP methyl ester carboxylesterase
MSEEKVHAIEADYLNAGINKAFTGGLASYRVADPVMASTNDATLQRMKQRIPNLHAIKIISDAGHFVQLEKSDETSTEIIEQLAGVK